MVGVMLVLLRSRLEQYFTAFTRTRAQTVTSALHVPYAQGLAAGSDQHPHRAQRVGPFRATEGGVRPKVWGGWPASLSRDERAGRAVFESRFGPQPCHLVLQASCQTPFYQRCCKSALP